MAERAIEARGLVKGFGGERPVIDGLDLEIEAGSVYALLGPNGSGKSTALRLLVGLLRPDAGSVRVLGLDLATARPSDRARVAHVGQGAPLTGWMTLAEHARMLSRFHRAWDVASFDRTVETLGIGREVPLDEVSDAERQKAALALALAARAEVLVLDEPLSGVDSAARRGLLAELIERLDAPAPVTVVLATGSIGGLERLADHAGVLRTGRLLVSGRVDALQESYVRVQAVFDGPVPAGFDIPGAIRRRDEGVVATATVRLDDEAHRRRIEATPGATVRWFPIGLEDLYLDLIGETRP